LQQTERDTHLFVRRALFFVPLAVTVNIHAQERSGHLDLLHGGDSMTLVVVIGHREDDVSLGQQIRGGGWPGNKIQPEAEHQTRKSHDGKGAEQYSFHNLTLNVIFADVAVQNHVKKDFDANQDWRQEETRIAVLVGRVRKPFQKQIHSSRLIFT
jgi:hypothetical protein